MSTYVFEKSGGGILVTGNGRFIYAFAPGVNVTIQPTAEGFLIVKDNQNILDVVASDILMNGADPITGTITEKVKTIIGLFPAANSGNGGTGSVNDIPDLLDEYEDNDEAILAGVQNGEFYRTGDAVKQVHP